MTDSKDAFSVTHSGKDFKYWAFLSYSHRDRAWGDWLHKALETYRVPRHLVGQPARHGVVPRRAYPVFRDREELPGSADLGENIRQALSRSHYLIVICSRRSAASIWVNEEIKQFKAMGREGRVLCLIVDGEPNASDKPGLQHEECFPEAIRYRVDSDGCLTQERTEPIAADARKSGDGKTNAKLKLLAGLLGVDYDALKQRDQARRVKRLQAITAASILLVATLSFLSVGFYRAKVEAQENLKEAYNHRGLASFFDERLAESFNFLNQARLIDPEQSFTDYALADIWTRIEDLDLELTGEQQAVTRIEWTQDSKRIALQDRVGRVRLYDTTSGKRILATDGQIQSMQAPAIARGVSTVAGYTRVPDPDDPDRVLRAIVSYDRDGNQRRNLAWPSELPDVDSMALSPSGRYLLSHVERIGESDITQLRDFKTPSAPATEIPHSGPFGNFRWRISADDRFLLQVRISGSGPFFAIVRSMSGEKIARMEFPGRPDTITLHGQLAAFGFHNGDVRIHDLSEPESPLWTADGAHPGGVSEVAFSADGARLLSTGTMGGIDVRSVNDGQTVWQRSTNDHDLIRDGISTGAISSDGEKVAVASRKTTVVYDLKTGERVIQQWHASRLTALAFSPDARRLAAADDTGGARIWKTESPDEPFFTRYEMPRDRGFTRIREVRPDRFVIGGNGTYFLNAETGSVTTLSEYGDRTAYAPEAELIGTPRWGQTEIAVIDNNGDVKPRTQLSHDDEALLAVPPVAANVAMIAVMPENKILGVDDSAAILPNKIDLPEDAGRAWAVRFTSDGSRGLVTFASGQLLEIGLDETGVHQRAWHRPLPPGETPTLVDVSRQGDVVLLKRNQTLYSYRPAKRQVARLNRNGLIGARFVGTAAMPRIAAVTMNGDLTIWTLDGSLVAESSALLPGGSGAVTEGSDVRAGQGVVSVGDDVVATSIDEHVYFWRASDARLIWRSGPLGESGWEPAVELISVTQDGKAIVATSSSGAMGSGSFDHVMRIPIPGNHPEFPTPSPTTVQRFVDNNLANAWGDH